MAAGERRFDCSGEAAARGTYTLYCRCAPRQDQLWDKLLAVLDGFDQATRISPAWTGGTTFGAVLSGLKNEVSPTDAGPVLAPGAVCGPYRVLKQLGAGGMGQVFLAKDQRLNRLVAIKSLAGRWLASPTARPRLLREARAAAALSHPNIATLYNVLEDSGLLVMEYINGRPASVLLRDGPIAVGYAVRLAFQITEAVSYAHDHGIIHCDIKPANVHVTVEGMAKVLDFGLARARFNRDEWEDLAPGQLLGTPGYMAPERLMRGTLNASGDLYSTGVTIFEMVTGRRPFEEDDLPTLLLAVLAGAAPKASSIVSHIPADLDRVIDRALVADPVQRYQSAREICRDMRSILASVETPSTINGVVSASSSAQQRQLVISAGFQRGLLVTGSVTAAVVVLTLLGGITSRSYDSAIGLTDGFSQESWLSWPIWGLRSLLAPVLFVGGSISLGIVLLTGIYRFLVTTVAPVRRLMQPIALKMNGLVERIRGSATSTTAPLILVTQFAVIVLTFWWFSELLSGLDTLIVQREGDLRQLSPANRPEHNFFRQVLSVQLFAFAAAWGSLLQARFRRRERGGVISTGGGLALTVFTLILLVYPYRILTHNEHERVSFHAQTCYLLGERGDEALLFCPTEVPPRNWIVKRDNPSLKRGGPTESVFSRLTKGND